MDCHGSVLGLADELCVGVVRTTTGSGVWVLIREFRSHSALVVLRTMLIITSMEPFCPRST